MGAAAQVLERLQAFSKMVALWRLLQKTQNSERLSKIV